MPALLLDNVARGCVAIQHCHPSSSGEQRAAIAGADVAGDGQRRFGRVGGGLGGVDAATVAAGAAGGGAAVAADGHGGREQRRHPGHDGAAALERT